MGLLGLSPWYAVLLGAALAPTDAALGATVMTDERVRYRIRQTLNVESGLNDGIATPVVTTAIAVIVLQAGSTTDFGLAAALLGLPIGVVVGLAIGIAGGTSLRIAHKRGWSSEAIAGPAVLALALLAFVIATLLLANGYVAAFVAGMAFGASAGRGGTAEVYYVEQTCGLASMLCWMLFGALAVPTLAADWSWRILLYAVISLTVVRMVPVALALFGSRRRLAVGDLHRLVRAPRPRLGRVRSDRRRGSPRRPGCRRRRGGHDRSLGPAERAPARTDGPAAGGLAGCRAAACRAGSGHASRTCRSATSSSLRDRRTRSVGPADEEVHPIRVNRGLCLPH